MDEKQKMATAGAALIAAGIGLGIVGASLIVPAVLSWAGRFAEKGADRLGAELEPGEPDHDATPSCGLRAGISFAGFM